MSREAPHPVGGTPLSRRATAGLLVLGLLVIALFVQLGRWQWHRHEAKVAVRDLVRAHYDAAPVPVADLLAPGTTPVDRSTEWRPVRATGRYDAALTLLARDRIADGDAGYEVLVPLRTAAGVLLVDRGWVPAGRTADGPRAVPAPPAGEVTVTVHLRPWQPPTTRRTPPGQVLRISRDAVASSTGISVDQWFQGYGLAAEESPAGAAIERVARPDVDLGPHLAYAVQWWSFAVVVGVLLVRAGRRRPAPVPPATGSPVPAPREDEGDRPVPDGPVRAGSRRSRWGRLTGSGGTVDEEAEDAELDAQQRRVPPAG
ncbi:MAG: SURF1 family protein [Kineosporiaceae bacterium]